MRRAKLLRLFMFLFVVWAGFVLVAEVGLRLAGFTPEKGREVPDQYNKFEADDLLIWSLRDNWKGLEPTGAAVRTNSLGLRGPELRSDADLRILFLGDSVTFGTELEENMTIPGQLEQQLNGGAGGPVEVVNAAVPGYSTFQSELYYRERGRNTDADVVLLGFCLNDVTERYEKVLSYGGSRFFMENVDTSVGLSLPRRIWRLSAIRTALVKTVVSSARHGEVYRVEQLWESPEAEHIVTAWQLVFDEIDDLHALTQAAGARLMVIVYPYARQAVEGQAGPAPQHYLAAHLRQRGIPVLNLLPTIRDAPIAVQTLYQDANHFTAVGAGVVAEEVARFLRESGVDVPPAEAAP